MSLRDFTSRLVSGSVAPSFIQMPINTLPIRTVPNISPVPYQQPDQQPVTPIQQPVAGDELGDIVDQISDWWNVAKDVGGGLGLALPQGSTGARRVYNNVFVKNGRIWTPASNGRMRMLGYTYAGAKKKFKTKRRRKRLTKRDMYFGEIARSSGNVGMLAGLI